MTRALNIPTTKQKQNIVLNASDAPLIDALTHKLSHRRTSSCVWNDLKSDC
jgi:hypothetical protein